jgi:pimeloyl-ACP methyl ester carboxylesterase
MPEGQELAEQALTVWAAIEAFADSHDVGAGVFLVGHSHGMRLAVHVAADSRGRHLLGLEASGAGIRFSREFLDRYPAVEPGSPEALRIVQDHRHLFWGPRQLYPPRTFERGTLPVEPIPKNDLMEARLWPGTYPELAARVQVPVQISMAEFEQFWDMSETAAAETRALYERAPHVAIRTQAAAGHNISLSWAARSYHLQLLAFAEQCVLWGSRPSPVVVKEAGPLS